MTETPEGVVVTQADRDAAASIAYPWNKQRFVDGNADNSATVQAFARHRLAHTPTLRGEEVERLREALEAQMVEQDEDLPSSLARQRGLVWLEGWFDLAAALSQPLAVDTGQSGEAPNPIESAPKDGTMIRLLVDYTDGGGPLEDEHPRAWTIGFNSFENTGEDEWKFAGWCWTHDHFSQGSGAPVGWLPWSNPSADGENR